MKIHDVVKLKKDFNGIKKNTKGTVIFLNKTSKFITVEFIINGNTKIETMKKNIVE